ncbi:hypothetical protein [Stenotrophomonas rhizophila]|uniref:hypothetical protein n=1 Tax=Stenotrophomonas rhizophila TaxID=216778 RepID=UPI001E472EE6|nr:hypothetical protein [Stenotrophomonas rhizophila]MCC7633840.1 hypothetical protein [Stenotrophomonas rhizophila]MCC7665390.1 hypothetical protein [Stenotrophomonas rhizophila]
MSLIQTTAVAVLLATTTAAPAAEGLRYLALLNRAHDSVTALAVAPAGSGRFRDMSIDALPGGGGATTVGVADAGCRYDLQVGFRNGRSVVYANVDVCRGGTLVISAMPKDGRYARTAAPAILPDVERRAASR